MNTLFILLLASYQVGLNGFFTISGVEKQTVVGPEMDGIHSFMCHDYKLVAAEIPNCIGLGLLGFQLFIFN